MRFLNVEDLKDSPERSKSPLISEFNLVVQEQVQVREIVELNCNLPSLFKRLTVDEKPEQLLRLTGHRQKVRLPEHRLLHEAEFFFREQERSAIHCSREI